MAERSVSIFYACYSDWGTMGSMVLLSVQTAPRGWRTYGGTGVVVEASVNGRIYCVRIVYGSHRSLGALLWVSASGE